MELEEKLNRYLEGLLPEDEKRILEDMIQKDPGIQEYIEKRKILEKQLESYLDNKQNEMADGMAKEDISRFLLNYIPENDEKEKLFLNELRQSTLRKKPWQGLGFFTGMAATVIIMLLVGTGLFINGRQARLMEYQGSLFKSYFQPSHDPLIIKLCSDLALPGNIPQPTDSVLRFYGDSFSGEVLRTADSKGTEFLFAALGKLQKNDFGQGIIQLESVMLNGYPELQDAARWYYSLAILAQGKKKKAIEELEKITRYENPYSSEADSLLRLLKAGH